jgi:hypothetical protein
MGHQMKHDNQEKRECNVMNWRRLDPETDNQLHKEAGCFNCLCVFPSISALLSLMNNTS